MTHTQNRSKSASLTLSSVMICTCLSVPLSAVADTSSSVDAIMEQLKTLNTQAPKVSTPASVETTIETTTSYAKETEIVDNQPAISPAVSVPAVSVPAARTVKIETVPTTSVYVSPQSAPEPIRQQTSSNLFAEPENIAPTPVINKKPRSRTRVTRADRAKRKRATRADRANKRKRATRVDRANKRMQPTRIAKANKRKQTSRSHLFNKTAANTNTNTVRNKNQGAVDYKGFDERYMSLIYDILNENPPVATSKVSNAITNGSFTGTPGWIYLGKYSRGQWKSGKTLKIGNAFPQVGQQYTVKSPLLNMRTDKPRNNRLGKLLKVLYVGDQVQIKHISRSSRNNYWANIVRP